MTTAAERAEELDCLRSWMNEAHHLSRELDLSLSDTISLMTLMRLNTLLVYYASVEKLDRIMGTDGEVH